MTEVLPYTQDEVWALLTDFEGIPERRPEVTTVEMTGVNEFDLETWTEHAEMDSYLNFECIEKVPPSKLVVRMRESSFGMTGIWTYELKASGDNTILTIKEESAVDRMMMRAMMSIAGRSSNLKEEFKTIKKALN